MGLKDCGKKFAVVTSKEHRDGGFEGSMPQGTLWLVDPNPDVAAFLKEASLRAVDVAIVDEDGTPFPDYSMSDLKGFARDNAQLGGGMQLIVIASPDRAEGDPDLADLAALGVRDVIDPADRRTIEEIILDAMANPKGPDAPGYREGAPRRGFLSRLLGERKAKKPRDPAGAPSMGVPAEKPLPPISDEPSEAAVARELVADQLAREKEAAGDDGSDPIAAAMRAAAPAASPRPMRRDEPAAPTPAPLIPPAPSQADDPIAAAIAAAARTSPLSPMRPAAPAAHDAAESFEGADDPEPEPARLPRESSMPKEGAEAGHGPDAGDGPMARVADRTEEAARPAAESLPPLEPRGPRADAGRDPAGMGNESRRPAEAGRAMPEGGPAAPAVDPESIRADLTAEFERRMREMASAYERKLALAMRGGREQRVFAVCSIVPEAPTTLAAVEAAIWAADRLPGMRATVVEHDPRKLPSLAPYGAIAPGDDALYPDVAVHDLGCDLAAAREMALSGAGVMLVLAAEPWLREAQSQAWAASAEAHELLEDGLLAPVMPGAGDAAEGIAEEILGMRPSSVASLDPGLFTYSDPKPCRSLEAAMGAAADQLAEQTASSPGERIGASRAKPERGHDDPVAAKPERGHDDPVAAKPERGHDDPAEKAAPTPSVAYVNRNSAETAGPFRVPEGPEAEAAFLEALRARYPRPDWWEVGEKKKNREHKGWRSEPAVKAELGKRAAYFAAHPMQAPDGGDAE